MSTYSSQAAVFSDWFGSHVPEMLTIPDTLRSTFMLIYTAAIRNARRSYGPGTVHIVVRRAWPHVCSDFFAPVLISNMVSAPIPRGPPARRVLTPIPPVPASRRIAALMTVLQQSRHPIDESDVTVDLL